MCRSKSSRKYFSALCSGSIGARRQRAEGVARARAAATCVVEHLQVVRLARALLDAPPGSAPTQGSPSRQGVHQPHDSWAKNRSRLQHHAHRAGLVVEDDHRAGAQPAAGLLHASRSPSARRGAPRRRKSVEAPPGSSAAEAVARRACRRRAPRGSRAAVVPIGSSQSPGPLHPAADAVDLRAAVRRCGSGP